MRQGLSECARLIGERTVRDDKTGCLVWVKGVTTKGYGVIRCDGVYIRTHRVSYMAAFGAIPEGAHVLHTCDNRRCCEPSHLYVGTNAQNIEDKMRRGRSGKALNLKKARRIKTMLTQGIKQSEIGRRFGVNPSLISRIKSGRYWPYASAQEA